MINEDWGQKLHLEELKHFYAHHKNTLCNNPLDQMWGQCYIGIQNNEVKKLTKINLKSLSGKNYRF